MAFAEIQRKLKLLAKSFVALTIIDQIIIGVAIGVTCLPG